MSRWRKKGQSFKTRLRNPDYVAQKLFFFCFSQFWRNQPICPYAVSSPETSKRTQSTSKKSPKRYSLLSKYFTLPSSKTMKLLLGKIKISPGINPVIFAKIKETIRPIMDRLVRPTFEEMSLTPHIFYNMHEDYLEEFASNQDNNFADPVLVLWWRV